MRSPARADVLGQLGPSHSTRRGRHRVAQRQPGRPTMRGATARPEQRGRALGIVVARPAMSDRLPVYDEVFTVVPHDPRRVHQARCDTLALTAQRERQRRAVYQ
jgi:hypothetical protein